MQVRPKQDLAQSAWSCILHSGEQRTLQVTDKTRWNTLLGRLEASIRNLDVELAAVRAALEADERRLPAFEARLGQRFPEAALLEDKLREWRNWKPISPAPKANSRPPTTPILVRLYATEELVVELASAIVGADLGLPVDHLDDHASYIANWLRTLKQDSRAILSIAARADEAAAYLLELGGRGPSTDTDDDTMDEAANDRDELSMSVAA